MDRSCRFSGVRNTQRTRRNEPRQAAVYSILVAWWKPSSKRIGETRRLHPFIGLETNNEIIARVENVPYVYGCWTNRGDSVDSLLSALLNAAIFLLIPRAIPWDLPLRVPCTPSFLNLSARNSVVRAVSATVSFCVASLPFRSCSKIEITFLYIYTHKGQTDSGLYKLSNFFSFKQILSTRASNVN